VTLLKTALRVAAPAPGLKLADVALVSLVSAPKAASTISHLTNSHPGDAVAVRLLLELVFHVPPAVMVFGVVVVIASALSWSHFCVVIVCPFAVKFAVTVAVPAPTVKLVVAAVVDENEPWPLTVQLLKEYPALGVAVSVCAEPNCHVPPGFTVPPVVIVPTGGEAGLTAVVMA